MNFGWAVERIKNGAGVRRDSWPAGVFLTMLAVDRVDPDTIEVCQPGANFHTDRISWRDILSTDWSQVDMNALQREERERIEAEKAAEEQREAQREALAESGYVGPSYTDPRTEEDEVE